MGLQAIAQARTVARPPETPAPRPSPSEIGRRYQVADDRVADWSPKLFGVIGLGGLGGTQNLTVREGRLLDNLTRDRGIAGLSEFRNIRDEAFAEADRREPPPAGPIPAAVEARIRDLPPRAQVEARALWPTNDGHNDAFRHAFWNARLASEFGTEWTAQFATAHEARPGNPSMREAMDLYNNEVGRRIATDNPGASPARLADLVQQAVRNGDLVVVDRSGRLAWSNAVAVGHHGISPSAPAQGRMQVPDGNASAQ